MGESIVFYAIACLMALTSVMVITSRNPVASAIFLVINLFMMAGMYALLAADFVAAIQIILYAGAIVVLFVFVIMLLNLQPDALKGKPFQATDIIMLLISIAGFLFVAVLIGGETPPPIAAGGIEEGWVKLLEAEGNTHALGMRLFSKFAWPFELASILILLAIVAAILIAKKDKTHPQSNS